MIVQTLFIFDQYANTVIPCPLLVFAVNSTDPGGLSECGSAFPYSSHTEVPSDLAVPA